MKDNNLEIMLKKLKKSSRDRLTAYKDKEYAGKAKAMKNRRATKQRRLNNQQKGR